MEDDTRSNRKNGHHCPVWWTSRSGRNREYCLILFFVFLVSLPRLLLDLSFFLLVCWWLIQSIRRNLFLLFLSFVVCSCLWPPFHSFVVLFFSFLVSVCFLFFFSAVDDSNFELFRLVDELSGECDRLEESFSSPFFLFLFLPILSIILVSCLLCLLLFSCWRL